HKEKTQLAQLRLTRRRRTQSERCWLLNLNDKGRVAPSPGTPQTQANGAHRRGLPSPKRKDYGSEAADDIFVAACHVCCLLRIYSTACSIAPARSHLKCQHTSFVSSVSPSSRISSKSP